MLWSAVLFGLLGVLIGMRYRAPALIPATLIGAVLGITAGWMARRNFGEVTAITFGLVAVLHAAYLVALAVRTRGR